MKVLVINCGSSSLKYQLIDMDGEKVLCKGLCERIGMESSMITHEANGTKATTPAIFPTHTEAFAEVVKKMTTGEGKVIDSMSEISAVGHRIVQGAEIFSKTTLVTDEVIQQIDDLSELAPVHNHPHALALRACKKVIPATTPQVVVFDTAFHSTMPEKAFMYGLPYECYEKLHVRKYGFHGTSHRFVTQALADAMGKDIKDLKIVSCHLGNGSSITAVEGGKSIDTSMGFTPLDGVIMGTRCGSVDPSAVTFVANKLGLSPNAMSDYMNKKSGFLGISGISSDNRDITDAAEHGDHKAQLAGEMLRYEIKKFIGSYAAVMNGLDAVIFTGGIGENSDDVRADVCHNMEYLGIKLDDSVNHGLRGKLQKISAPDSKVEVWVVPTNEELLIARDTKALVGNL